MKHCSYIALIILQLCLSTYAENNSSLMRFLRGRQMQTIIEKMVGKSIYERFIKTKTAQENERLALEQNPQPWEKFSRKDSYWQRMQNWLSSKSRGQIGKRIATIGNYYDWPNTKEGKRAHLLQILYEEDPINYKEQWLNKNRWDKLTENKKISGFLKQENNNTLPQYGEFWLQTYVPAKQEKTLTGTRQKPLIENQ